MKKLFILTAAVMLSATFVKAQTADPELDYIKKAYSKEKKEIVNEYMKLDSLQTAKFWPVYTAYETSREKLALQRIQLLDEYDTNTASLTPELVDKLANALLTNSISLDKLNLTYYKKMKKAAGAINAAKYMQLEVYLQTTWRSVLQELVPLVGELDKTKKD